MKNLKYINDSQFISDFASELKNSLGNHVIEINKPIGLKTIDLFIENRESGQTYSIEIKGRPNENSLPPEIIPWLEIIKNRINKTNNHFIVISLSYITNSTKSLFKQSGLEVFEYRKHEDNFIGDFISFLNGLK